MFGGTFRGNMMPASLAVRGVEIFRSNFHVCFLMSELMGLVTWYSIVLSRDPLFGFFKVKMNDV